MRVPQPLHWLMNPQYTNVKVEGPSFPTKGQLEDWPEVNIHVNDGAFGPRNLLLLPRKKKFTLVPEEWIFCKKKRDANGEWRPFEKPEVYQSWGGMYQACYT